MEHILRNSLSIIITSNKVELSLDQLWLKFEQDVEILKRSAKNTDVFNVDFWTTHRGKLYTKYQTYSKCMAILSTSKPDFNHIFICILKDHTPVVETKASFTKPTSSLSRYHHDLFNMEISYYNIPSKDQFEKFLSSP